MTPVSEVIGPLLKEHSPPASDPWRDRSRRLTGRLDCGGTIG
jgi:hypothetical protein